MNHTNPGALPIQRPLLPKQKKLKQFIASIIDSRAFRAFLVVISQIVVFIIISRIAWKTAKDTGYVIPTITIYHVNRTPSPPPPPPTPRHAKGSSDGGGVPEAPAPPLITTITNSQKIESLMVSPPLPNMNTSQMVLPLVASPAIPNIEFPTQGTSEGIGSGDGTGPQSGKKGLYGLDIETTEHILVVLDVSGSMLDRDGDIREEIKAKFPSAVIVESCSAYGKFDDAGTPDSDCDLYEAAKRGMINHSDITSVYLFTDFEDGNDKDDTVHFIKFLDSKKIKLYVRSVEKPAYDGLPEYANRSGGQYECPPEVDE